MLSSELWVDSETQSTVLVESDADGRRRAFWDIVGDASGLGERDRFAAGAIGDAKDVSVLMLDESDWIENESNDETSLVWLLLLSVDAIRRWCERRRANVAMLAGCGNGC